MRLLGTDVRGIARGDVGARTAFAERREEALREVGDRGLQRVVRGQVTRVADVDQQVGVARPDNRNNWECALSEAAFMTGLVRNADVVRMASYAPLFAHVDAWQWTPDLIWFDNLRSYGTPNYYVQKLFSLNKGTTILPVLLNASPKNGQSDLFTSATFDKHASEIVVTIVNA